MDIYTVSQKNVHKASRLGIPIIDITVLSGVLDFAPTWDLLNEYKAGGMSQERYTIQYTKLMRESYLRNPKLWFDTVHLKRVALVCYCPPKHFCHRHILAVFLQMVAMQYGLEASICEEIC